MVDNITIQRGFSYLQIFGLLKNSSINYKPLSVWIIVIVETVMTLGPFEEGAYVI